MMEPSKTAHSPKWPVVMKMPPRVGAQPLGGDGVIAEPFFWLARVPTTRLNILLAVAGVGWLFLLGRFLDPNLSIFAVGLAGVCLVGFVIMGIMVWIDRVRARGVLSEEYVGPPRFALRCLLTPAVRREREKWFDVSNWLAVYPEATSPRVVLEGVDVATPLLPDDVLEETDLVSERKITRRTRVRVTAALIAILCLDCWIIYSALAMPKHLVSLFAVQIASHVWAIWAYADQLGVVPFHLRSVVVAPGSVSFSRIRGGPLRFERSDSVLLLYKVNRFVCARMCRVDGQTAMFAFRDGPRSPGLAQLLSRWCYPVLVKQEAVEGS